MNAKIMMSLTSNGFVPPPQKKSNNKKINLGTVMGCLWDLYFGSFGTAEKASEAQTVLYFNHF